MRKRILAASAAALLTIGIAGCSSGGDGGSGGDSRTFRVAFNQNITHPQAQAILELSDRLKEATDGRYAMELFPDGTLGSQEATIEQTQSGTIDFAIIAGSLLESYSPDFAVVNLPYIYDSPEHQMAVLNDPEIVEPLYDTLASDNIRVLAAYHGGVRNVYAGKPVTTPNDLSGMKIRVIGSETNVRMMQLMGGVGTPMAQDEVYTALQSGVLDGAENNELIYSSLSHDEVAPYYSYTQHLMMPDFLITSPTVWDGLDEEARTTIESLLAESVDSGLAAFDSAVDAAEAEAEAAGTTFVEADVDAFREAVLPLHRERVTTPQAQSLYDAISAAQTG